MRQSHSPCVHGARHAVGSAVSAADRRPASRLKIVASAEPLCRPGRSQGISGKIVPLAVRLAFDVRLPGFALEPVSFVLRRQALWDVWHDRTGLTEAVACQRDRRRSVTRMARRFSSGSVGLRNVDLCVSYGVPIGHSKLVSDETPLRTAPPIVDLLCLLGTGGAPGSSERWSTWLRNDSCVVKPSAIDGRSDERCGAPTPRCTRTPT